MTPNRRSILKYGGLAGAAGLAGCAGGGGDTPTPRVERETVVRERTVVQEQTVVRTQTQDLTEMHTIAAEADASVPVYLYGINQGTWREHGIDLSVEVAAFGKYLRQLVTDLTRVGHQSVPPMMDLIGQGENLTFIGGALAGVNSMFAQADDDSIESPADLEGKTVGLPFANSAATKTFVALVLDGWDIDLREDTAETRYAPPPVLLNLLKDGEIDAIGEFVATTIQAMVDPALKNIFTLNDYWQDQTGTVLPITNFTTTHGFLEDDPGLVLDFMRGWEDAHSLFLDNIDQAITNYGRLAGLTTEDQAARMKELMLDGQVFGPPFLDSDTIDAHWQFIQSMEDAGFVPELPDKDQLFQSRSELEDLAG